MENKFRGLRQDRKGWVYGMPTYDLKYIFNETNVDSIDNYEVIPETVGQLHNGLTKKAGKEVYVGDKISYRLAAGLGFPESEDKQGIVETIEDHFGYYKNVVVTGNIHQGKEIEVNGI